MKTVSLDDETHLEILKRTSFVGETEVSILRRLLGLSASVKLVEEERRSDAPEIDQLLKSREFQHAIGAVGRFLLLLKLIHEKYPDNFGRIESIRGRGRLYFARDEKSLSDSGTSVNPKPIPGSHFWVITNTSTGLKNEILATAMRIFNYSESDISKATTAVAAKSVR